MACRSTWMPTCPSARIDRNDRPRAASRFATSLVPRRISYILPPSSISTNPRALFATTIYLPLFSLVLPLERTSNANGEADVLRRFIRSGIRKRRHEPGSHVLLLAGSLLRAPPDQDVRFGRLLKSALLEELLPFVLGVIAQGPVDGEVAATAEIFSVRAVLVRHIDLRPVRVKRSIDDAPDLLPSGVLTDPAHVKRTDFTHPLHRYLLLHQFSQRNCTRTHCISTTGHREPDRPGRWLPRPPTSNVRTEAVPIPLRRRR